MTRPRAYHRDDVLEAATALFWEKGYEGASMNDLVACTRLNKHSMYKEFGDKDGLFLACLDYYVTHSLKALREILTAKPLGLRNIEKFYANRVEYAASKNCKGCLLMNTVTEKESLNDRINKTVQVHLGEIEMLLYHCLKGARQRGEIGADKDCRVMAQYLDCVNRGMMNIGKQKREKTSLKKLADIALSVLRK